MHRFYLPEKISGDTIVITRPELLAQLTRVLRLQAGDRCSVFDGSGSEHICEVLAFGKREAQLLVIETAPCRREPRKQVTLYASPLKGDHFELVLQKAAELGVSVFVPVICERTIVRSISDQKKSRYAHILMEATEQCGGCIIPALADPIPLPQALAAAGKKAVLCYEAATGEGGAALRGAQALFIGPEGGFTEAEVALAEEAGVSVISLGARILRAETAAITASALALLA